MDCQPTTPRFPKSIAILASRDRRIRVLSHTAHALDLESTMQRFGPVYRSQCQRERQNTKERGRLSIRDYFLDTIMRDCGNALIGNFDLDVVTVEVDFVAAEAVFGVFVAGFHVEGPAVPRAGDLGTLEPAIGKRSARVRAGIADGEIVSFDIEYGDTVLSASKRLALAVRYVRLDPYLN